MCIFGFRMEAFYCREIETDLFEISLIIVGGEHLYIYVTVDQATRPIGISGVSRYTRDYPLDTQSYTKFLEKKVIGCI